MWLHLHAGKHILLQRGQRQRKKPQWLDNTIDPHMTDKKWGLPSLRQVPLLPKSIYAMCPTSLREAIPAS